jgi:hypothetical protein
MLRPYLLSASSSIRLCDDLASIFNDKLLCLNPDFGDAKAELIEAKGFGTSGMKQNVISIVYGSDLDVQFGPPTELNKISIKLKCLTFNCNISILVFSNGSIRLSSGLRNISMNNDTDLSNLLRSHSRFLLPFSLDKDIEQENFKINILNSTFDAKVSNVYALSRFVSACGPNETEATRMGVVLPDPNRGGRIGAARFYLHAGKKLHIALDNKGKAQIFGATNITQSIEIMNRLLSCIQSHRIVASSSI